MQKGPNNMHGRRLNRPISPKKEEGVDPPNDHVRQLILTVSEQFVRHGAQRIQAELRRKGDDIQLDVIIGVLNGK